jgi:hypothetical protein
LPPNVTNKKKYETIDDIAVAGVCSWSSGTSENGNP